MGSVTHQLGFAEETTYGTVVPVTKPLRVLAGSGVGLKTQILKSEGMVPSQRFPAAATANQVARHGEGTLNFEVAQTGMGLLLKHMLGTDTPTSVQQASTIAYLQTFILGGTTKSLTIQSGIQRADTPTTVEPYTAVGCMFPGWTFSCAVDEYAKFAVDVHARDVLDADNDSETLDTLTYGAVSLFDFSMAAFTSDAVAVPQVNSFTLTAAWNLLTDRRHLGNTGLVSQPRNVFGDTLTGTFEAEFTDPVNWYNDFHSNTTVALVLTMTGPLIVGAHYYYLTITLPACKILGDGAMINNDVPTVTVPFEVLQPASAQPITITYMTTDVTVSQMPVEFTVKEQVGDLAAAAKLLRKVDKDLAKELGQDLRDAVAKIKKGAQGRMAGRPGGGTYPVTPSAIRSGASPTKASAWVGYPAASVARYPWALGAEYGATSAIVRAGRGWRYGRAMLQTELSRRQFAPWVGNQFATGASGSGWIVGAELKENFPKLEREILDIIDEVFRKALARAG